MKRSRDIAAELDIDWSEVPEMEMPPDEESNGSGAPKIRSITDIPSVFSFANQKTEWCIEDILPAGSVGALTGPSGDGKTTIAIAMAHKIERGEPFAGMATQRRPVLILDRENPLSAIIERYARFGIRDGENFHHWGGWCPEEAPDAAGAMVMQWVVNTTPKPLIIVDSLVAFACCDENDASEIRAHMQGYRRLADLGATVIILHHSGKGESTKDFRGSSDIKASLDVGYVVTNIGDPARLETIRMKAFKARFSVNPEVILRVRDGEFQVDEYNDPTQTNTGIFRALLIANPGVMTAEFERLAVEKGSRRNRARQWLADGIVSGCIRVENGQNNKRFHYWQDAPNGADSCD
jgi:archaellum biogenesis ATPase FlaH